MPTVNRRAVVAAVLINVAILASMTAAKTRVGQVRHTPQAMQILAGGTGAATTGVSVEPDKRPSSTKWYIR